MALQLISKDNPGRPLAFHTLPHRVNGRSKNEQEHDLIEDDGKGKPKKGISSCVANIPRLISIVEIIKREFLKSQKEDAKTVELFQYNDLGASETASLAQFTATPLNDEALRLRAVESALDGQNLCV